MEVYNSVWVADQLRKQWQLTEYISCQEIPTNAGVNTYFLKGIWNYPFKQIFNIHFSNKHQVLFHGVAIYLLKNLHIKFLLLIAKCYCVSGLHL